MQLRFRAALWSIGLAGASVLAAAQTQPTSGPTTRPASAPSTKPADPRALTSDQMLGNMLRPPPTGQVTPLQPVAEAPEPDRLSGPGAVKPAAPSVPTLREGTLLVDKTGRLAKSADGTQTQFIFEADGKAMKDPPMIILPNIKLMVMENIAAGATHELRFRVSGSVTEYRGRNYLLLEKVVVPSEVTQQF